MTRLLSEDQIREVLNRPPPPERPKPLIPDQPRHIGHMLTSVIVPPRPEPTNTGGRLLPRSSALQPPPPPPTRSKTKAPKKPQPAPTLYDPEPFDGPPTPPKRLRAEAVALNGNESELITPKSDEGGMPDREACAQLIRPQEWQISQQLFAAVRERILDISLRTAKKGMAAELTRLTDLASRLARRAAGLTEGLDDFAAGKDDPSFSQFTEAIDQICADEAAKASSPQPSSTNPNPPSATPKSDERGPGAPKSNEDVPVTTKSNEGEPVTPKQNEDGPPSTPTIPPAPTAMNITSAPILSPTPTPTSTPPSQPRPSRCYPKPKNPHPVLWKPPK